MGAPLVIHTNCSFESASPFPVHLAAPHPGVALGFAGKGGGRHTCSAGVIP